MAQPWGKFVCRLCNLSRIIREQSAAKPRPDNFHPVKSLKYLIVEIKSRKTCSLDECLL
jgi:hypothetical protein